MKETIQGCVNEGVGESVCVRERKCVFLAPVFMRRIICRYLEQRK